MHMYVCICMSYVCHTEGKLVIAHSTTEQTRNQSIIRACQSTGYKYNRKSSTQALRRFIFGSAKFIGVGFEDLYTATSE